MSADPLAAPTRGPLPRASGRPPRLHRLPSRGYAGGVCAGLADYFGTESLLFRVGFVVLAAFGGSGVAVYVLAWAVVPAGGPSGSAGTPGLTGRAGDMRALAAGAWREAAGIALLVLAGLLFLRQLGFWPGDAIVWPLVLASSGLALVARQMWGTGASAESSPDPRSPSSPATTPPSPTATLAPHALTDVPVGLTHTGAGAGGGRATPVAAVAARATTAPSLPGGLLGAMLIVGAAIVFLEATGTLAALREALVGIVVVVVVLGLVFGPWMARQARALAGERAERIRSQERAELAAHLHDSVLQTLALIQRRSGDARTVGTLARRQERELRQWLSGVAPAAAETSLAAALSAAAQEIEELHGVEVEVVTVGDCRLDDRLRALVGAAREAMANAARFSGAEKVDLYAEVEAGASVQAFVRDRGAGFDPASVPADRRGLRESIIGRMERHDGGARVESVPGQGTEVELTMELKS